MKKFLLLATAMVFVLGFVACGGGGDKTADTKAVMEEYVNLFDSLATSLDGAGSASEVASAMDSFTEGMDKLVPKMKELQEKYPDMLGEGKEPPAEFKPLMDKLQNEIMPK